MISTTMAVAAAGPAVVERAEYARDARLARLLALAFDSIIFSVIASVANAVFGVTQVTWGSAIPTNGVAYYGTETSIPWILTSVIYLGYFTAFEATFGATPGKAMCRLRVVSADGGRLTVRAVLVRNVLRIVDALPVLYLLGGGSVILTPRSQRIGDLAAGTTVVYRHRVENAGATRKATPAARRVFWVALAALIAATAVFDYFGRPPLVVESLFNQHQLLEPQITGYSLGPPAWSPGRVRYPLTASEPDKACTGWIELDWHGLAGWQQSSGALDCVSSG